MLIREVALRDQAIVNREDFDGRIESFSSSPATHYDHSRKNPSLKFGGLSDEARLFIDYDWHNPSLVIDKRTDNIDL